MSRTDQDPEQDLVRAIGPWSLGANAVNLMIGAGIFALPAVVAATLGPAAVIAYLVCGALIILVLLCYVELGTRITRSGGTVAYIEEAFGPLAGFLAWALYGVGFCAASTAAIAHVMLDALATVVPALAGSGAARSVAIVLIFGGVAALNVRGVKIGTGLSFATTTAKLVPLLLLIVVGAFALKGTNLVWTGWPPLSAFGSTILVLFFAFSSAEASLSPSGEIRNPARTIPRGLLGGATVVVLIYLAVQIVAQGVLGPELAQGTSTPLADVARRLMGPAGAGLIIAATAISVFGNLAADMVCSPRTFLAAAESGLLPRALGRVHPTYHTPWIAILVYVGIMIALALSGGFRPLAVLASMSLLLVYLAVCLAALRIRYSRPHIPGTFRAPGGPTVALVASAVVIWVLAQSTRREVVAMAIFIGGSTLYYLIRRWTLSAGPVIDG
ncbi:MAG TPA: APC family permease [Gemmatimonadales bacterium]|nr:APC family permease [Gemmatimonadales bacterium]